MLLIDYLALNAMLNHCTKLKTRFNCVHAYFNSILKCFLFFWYFYSWKILFKLKSNWRFYFDMASSSLKRACAFNPSYREELSPNSSMEKDPFKSSDDDRDKDFEHPSKKKANQNS